MRLEHGRRAWERRRARPMVLLEPLSVGWSALRVGTVNRSGQARLGAGRAVPSQAVGSGEVEEAVRQVTAALPGGGEERVGQITMAVAQTKPRPARPPCLCRPDR